MAPTHTAGTWPAYPARLSPLAWTEAAACSSAGRQPAQLPGQLQAPARGCRPGTSAADQECPRPRASPTPTRPGLAGRPALAVPRLVISHPAGPGRTHERATDRAPVARRTPAAHCAGLAAVPRDCGTGSARDGDAGCGGQLAKPTRRTAAGCSATKLPRPPSHPAELAVRVLHPLCARLTSPPSPHSATSRGPISLSPVSRASSSASRPSRPARNTGRGASRSTRPAAT